MGTDTVSGIHPQILDAINEASKKKAPPYGNDVFTDDCKEMIAKVFEKDDLEILPMMSGTASNSIALSSFLRSYGSVLCHNDAHINKDEGGAPEFFSCGGKLITITNSLGRLSANQIKNKIEEINFKGKHSSHLCGVSITQLAENGTVYSKPEILKINQVCKRNNLYLHMDGARFSNALVYLKSLSPADVTWKIGVDCLSLGATKNGAMAAEVVIFFNKDLANEGKKFVKQTGHVIPKTRFISAQINAWLKDGLWLKLAKKANDSAAYLSNELSQFREFRLFYPVEGNEVFFKITRDTYHNLINLNVIANLWRRIDHDYLVIRFVTSFETEISEIDDVICRVGSFSSRN